MEIITSPYINSVFGKEKKMRGKKIKGKKMSGFLFSISMFGWKENKRKENRRRIIFFCLFVWKSERKEKDNDVKWQYYPYIIIKGYSNYKYRVI